MLLLAWNHLARAAPGGVDFTSRLRCRRWSATDFYCAPGKRVRNPRQVWPPFFTWLDFRQFEAGHRHEGGSPQVEQRGVVAKSARCSGTAHPCVLARLQPGAVQPLPACAQKLYAY